MSYEPPLSASVNFNFDEAGYLAPDSYAVNFNFTEAVATEAELTLNATLPPLQASIQFEHPSKPTLQLNAQLPALTAAIRLYHDNYTDLTLNATMPMLTASIGITHVRGIYIHATMPSGLTANVKLAWGEKIPVSTFGGTDTGKKIPWNKNRALQHETHSSYIVAPFKEPTVCVAWQEAQANNANIKLPFKEIPEQEALSEIPWDSFNQRINQNKHLPHRAPPAKDKQYKIVWGDFVVQINYGTAYNWNYPLPTDRAIIVPFFRADEFGFKLVWDTRNYTPPSAWAVHFNFTDAYTVPDQLAFNFSYGAPSPYGAQPIRPTDNSRQLAYDGVVPAIDVSRDVVWGEGSWTRPELDRETEGGWVVEQDELPPRPPQPQIKEVYIYMPNITLYRTPDGAEFEASDVTWSCDADSWAWRFNATLTHAADIALLKPDSNGPREIACEINGHLFTAMVNSYSPSRQFGQHRISISGISRSGWLGEPYAPARSKVITTPYTARQLAEMELASTGWLLEWQAEDWLIPANAYSYEALTPISAIKRIAETIGAIVQSHPSSKTLIVKPRYPVSPHKWAQPTTPLDAILPADYISHTSANYVSKPLYNRAITAGGAVGGVIVTLTKDGTAGDILAPMITDPLITHQTAGYERGRIEIANGGTWEEMNFTTWLTEQGVLPGLLLPGHLVEVQDTTETYPVQITGTTVRVQCTEEETKVRQQLQALRSITSE